MFKMQFSSVQIVKICIILQLLLFNVYAGTTGKIAGRIIDSNTNEPLVAANVIIEGSLMGATTDNDGLYYIINIPPGTYNVQALYI
jgi:hypothetical protein